ncbi:MAG: hypothetical protein JWO82_4417 [Akkermansiaceae bacterium]|nr:hypothetical protein [Akkermansiaceae bacterium]
METYTPGHSETATDFMSQRTWETHGGFFRDFLSPGMNVLDLACGPGTITLGIAAHVHPGQVMGVDIGEAEISRAQENATDAGVENVSFLTGSAYSLPLEDHSVNAVFCHGLFEHLQFPDSVMEEIHRVLKPGGLVGLCSPDWGGFVLSPASPEIDAAIETYMRLQSANGGDVKAGRKLGAFLDQAGFEDVQMNARYECYASLPRIALFLAERLESVGEKPHAEALKTWSVSRGGMFAQAWISAVGRKA